MQLVVAKDKFNEATTVASPRSYIESYAVVLTWRYPDGTWNTETINQDDLPDSFKDYLTEYEKQKE